VADRRRVCHKWDRDVHARGGGFLKYSNQKAEPRTVPTASCGGEESMRAAAQAGSLQKPQMSEEAFKNVQLLKGIPVDEFMGAMGFSSAAVSMCCLECHAPDWAADTRERSPRAR